MKKQFLKCEAIIAKLSHQYIYKFSNNTLYDLDDLISEGWIIYLKCKEKEKEIEGEFTTYLYTSVENRFKSLYRQENVYGKRKHTKVDIEGLDFDSKNLTPEKTVMAIQAIVALSEVSYDFATMVIKGVPKELLFVARRHMRSKKIGNNFKYIGENITFPKHLIEDFFKIDLDKIKILASKYW